MRTSSSSVVLDRQTSSPSLLPLVVGDLLAFLLFVVLGRLSHGFSGDWLVNVVRILTPFLVAWFGLALPLGGYRLALVARPSVFLARTLLLVVMADLLAFLLRSVVFGNNITWAFALTSLAFTALFVLGWRFAFLWLVGRGRQRS